MTYEETVFSVLEEMRRISSSSSSPLGEGDGIVSSSSWRGAVSRSLREEEEDGESTTMGWRILGNGRITSRVVSQPRNDDDDDDTWDPRVRYTFVTDDDDDGGGDDAGDDEDEDDNDSKADDYDGGDGDDKFFQVQQQRTYVSSASSQSLLAHSWLCSNAMHLLKKMQHVRAGSVA